MQIFGTLPDGRDVHRISLQSGGLSAQVLTLGAIVQDLRLDGVAHPLVLGCPDVASYLGPARYFGAIVGRFANRIGGGRFTIDGRDYRTDPNFLGRHTLHGGADGADVQIWQVEGQTDDHVIMGLTMADGHMGFPGNLRITVRIALQDDALEIVLTAVTDAPTICSLAHHGFFDLDGQGDVRRHALMIAADRYLPVDSDLIPTGEAAMVTDTDFDFRRKRMIGTTGYDHNFCLSNGQQPLRPVAQLTGESGLSMVVETTSCGLQLYDGAHIDGIGGLDGRRYGRHAGLALETQFWPDAPNRPGFASPILRPGREYQEVTRYRFAWS